MKLKKELSSEISRLHKSKDYVEKRIANLEKKSHANIFVKCRKRTWSYYEQIPDGSEKYISIKNKKDLISNSIAYSYYSSLLSILEHEIHAIELFNSSYKPERKYDAYNRLSAGRKIFVNPVFQSIEDKVAKWNAETKASLLSDKKSVTNDLYKNAVFKTTNGEMVRSKSELYIANELERRGIPYRYEDQLSFSDLYGKVFHPDFHILNPYNGRDYYWEHLGMLNDGYYMNSVCEKINIYIKHGIIPGDNLILTYETNKAVLDTDVVKILITKFFSKE